MKTATVKTTSSNFEKDVTLASMPVLVDFWAEWCGPCKAVAPKLEEIALELKEKLRVAKLDVDMNGETAARFGIRSIPTMILFKNGNPVGQIQGNQSKEDILNFLKMHV
jgi:thioredoxin 1